MILIFGAEDMNLPEGWSVVEERLMREFKFPNFSEAKNLVDALSIHAENVNHHPDVHFGWGYVIIELFTHDKGKITESDVQLSLIHI